MLSKLEIQHYKSLYDVKVDLDPLTVFIGPNGSGKSNICEAIAVLSNLLTLTFVDNHHIRALATQALQSISREATLESKFWRGKLDHLTWTSVPYIKPEDGGKAIALDREGALHTLIRRELQTIGIVDCHFVHRHPSIKERGVKLRTGHAITEPRYLSQIIIAWKPEEVDLIVIVVDADADIPKRQREIERALNTIRDNHLDKNGHTIRDRSVGGVAIRNFETWLLADTETITKILEVGIDCGAPTELEEVGNTKAILEDAIARSNYWTDPSSNQRPLQIRWELAKMVDLNILKNRCPQGYAPFAQSLSEMACTAVSEVSGSLVLRDVYKPSP